MNPIQLSLSELANKINTEHYLCGQALREGLQHAINAGEYLAEAKTQCQHGQWLAWIKANCRFSERTAQNYMRIAENKAELMAKAQRVADLTYREAVAILSDPKPQDTKTNPLDSREALISFIEVANRIDQVRKMLSPEAFEEWCKAGLTIECEAATEYTMLAQELAKAWCAEAIDQLQDETITLHEVACIKAEAERLQVAWSEFRLRGGQRLGELLA